MRIAQLYHDFSQRGGAERHVETLADSLRGLGHDVTVVSGFGRRSALFSAWRLARWMRRERVQLVHAHSRIPALVAAMAARLYHVPLVVTSHILPRSFVRLSQWGDETICVSEAVRQRLIRDYRVEPHKATVIHNGVELAGTGPTPDLGPSPVIAFVARFAAGKGHEMFLETARGLLAGGFPGTFVLAGTGPLEEGLRGRYASGRIRFLGHRNDVPAILAGSAVSVVCSESEAFPYVVLESLSVGTPVISTACGGPSEAIRNGRDGFLFPVGDAQSLHRLLAAVSAPRPVFAPRSEIARECQARFSRGRMVEATLDVYRRICP